MSVIVSTNEFGRVMLQEIPKHNSMYSMIDAKYKKQGRTPIVMLTRQWHTSILSRILNYNSINLSVACSKMLGHIYNHPKAVNFDRDSRTEWCLLFAFSSLRCRSRGWPHTSVFTIRVDHFLSPLSLCSSRTAKAVLSFLISNKIPFTRYRERELEWG